MPAIDLERYGPRGTAPPATPKAARRYCRGLARSHYENFTVTHLLLPRKLRQHLANVYAYCRWADDLADELTTGSSAAGSSAVGGSANPQRSLALLNWWERELRACYAGQTRHPVFVALAETIQTFDLPIDPLVDLLVAFRQDQRVTRYETFDDLLGYCRYSANPVGRIVLHLGRSATPERIALSDRICTGLQLVNFWQDVAEDFDRGRIYLPQNECRRFGYGEPDFAARRVNDAFRRLLASQVEHAEGLLRQGAALVPQLPPGLRLQIALFIEGGLAVAGAIRQHRFDVWTERPRLSTIDKLRLFARCWWTLPRGSHVES
ncbi:MAG: squalene synthase HpnC [Patescibacteria group bacterium]|nr:squalene synthase HpnC [Patescibacteria group bacterium]